MFISLSYHLHTHYNLCTTKAEVWDDVILKGGRSSGEQQACCSLVNSVSTMDHMQNNGLNNAHPTPGVLSYKQLPTHSCIKRPHFLHANIYAHA